MEASVAQTKANMFRRGGAGAGSTAGEGSSGVATPTSLAPRCCSAVPMAWFLGLSIAGEDEGQLHG
jgi:hypothetical protein